MSWKEKSFVMFFQNGYMLYIIENIYVVTQSVVIYTVHKKHFTEKEIDIYMQSSETQEKMQKWKYNRHTDITEWWAWEKYTRKWKVMYENSKITHNRCVQKIFYKVAGVGM